MSHPLDGISHFVKIHSLYKVKRLKTHEWVYFTKWLLQFHIGLFHIYETKYNIHLIHINTLSKYLLFFIINKFRYYKLF